MFVGGCIWILVLFILLVTGHYIAAVAYILGTALVAWLFSRKG